MHYRQKIVLVLFLLTVFGALPAQVRGSAPEVPSSRKPAPQSACVPQEILIRVKPGVGGGEVGKMHRRFGGDPLRRIERAGIHRVRFGSGVDIDKAIEQYRASGLVVQAERHAVRFPQAAVVPNDTFYAEQWAANTADVQNAWSIARTDRPVVVAVIDTGIDYTHPDLQQSLWINEAEKTGQRGVDDDGNGYVDDLFGWDFVGNDADPMDFDGHGTHVAGIVGAVSNNGVGVAGIGANVRIMPLKVTDDYTQQMNGSDILEALEYAREKGVGILNCSFGGGYFSDIEYEVLKTLQQRGALVVCAAGNAGVNIDLAGNAMYPASYDLTNIIAVAASGQSGGLAAFSNFGAQSVDLMAPGVDIFSTWPVAIAATKAEVVRTATGAAYAAAAMTFAGTTGPEGIAGDLYDCGYGNPGEIPDAVSGNIALLRRGSADGSTFYFSDKIANVQAKGAVGAVIYNNVPGSFDGTLGSPADWVPVAAISEEDGLALRQATPVGIRLVNCFTDDRRLYGLMSGTSMATPHVSGLVALMRARRPESGFADIKAAILDSVVFDQSAAAKTVSGGRVDPYAALGQMLTPGDVTGDDRVRLDDLITTLQVLSGIRPAGPIVFHPETSDVNGDGRIGMEEGLYILDRVTH